ncbi:hypothetical protein PROFUN_05143 [Planoprotostelium fungivorum]|uniref:Uncharacterized protein n=1 Tax=Planoprotostelium fungivorum TaxID=1890364 RepID=A0A2P6NRS4_9EUKA|nr:hypothetical protein PROFUN_05143 [Planoprotostelium fungivorum]
MRKRRDPSYFYDFSEQSGKTPREKITEQHHTSRFLNPSIMSVPDERDEDRPDRTSQFLSTLYITTGASVALFLFFIVMRRFRPHIYLRKCYIPSEPDFYKSNGFFNWIYYTLRYDTEHHLLPAHGGLDMVLYLNFLKYAFFLFAFFTLYSLPILIPVYYKQDKFINDELQNKTINSLNLGNVPDESSSMWATMVANILFSVAGFAFLYHYYATSVKLKLKAEKLNRGSRSAQPRTVMVSELPMSVGTDRSLKQKIQEIFPENSITDAILIPHSVELRRYQEKRKKVYQEQCFEECRRAEGQYPLQLQKKMKSMVNRKGSVDALVYYKRRLHKLDLKIEQIQQGLGGETGLAKHLRSCVGFVQFSHPASAQMAAQTVVTGDFRRLKITMAPEPDDIIWKNLGFHYYVQLPKIVVTVALLLLLFFSWSAPVAFFNAIPNAARLGFLHDFAEKNPFLNGILTGLLPTLGIKIFMALLPTILTYINSVSSHHSYSSWDRALLISLFSFLYIFVFFVAIIAGSLSSAIKKISTMPANQIPDLLSSTLGGQTTIFTNYILVSIVDHLLFQSRLFDILTMTVKKRMSHSTLERAVAEEPNPFKLVVKLANELLIFSIAFTYSSIGPLVNVLAMIYFGLGFFTSKHTLLFAYELKYEGISFVPIVVSALLFPLCTNHLLMAGVFSFKDFPPGASVAIALFWIGLLFYFLLNRRFHESFMNVPLTEFCDTPTGQEIQDLRENYLDPSLKGPDAYTGHLRVVRPCDEPHAPVERFSSNGKPIQSENTPLLRERTSYGVV